LAGERNVSQYMLQVELHPPNNQYLPKVWSRRPSEGGVYSHAMELNFPDFMNLPATVKFDLEEQIAAMLFQDLCSEKRSESVGMETDKFSDNESTSTMVGASSP